MRILSLGALALLSACPSGPPGDCKSHAAATQTVEVGLGENSFSSIVPETGTTIAHGAQGGSHVWTAVRATGFDPKDVTIELSAVDAFSGTKLGEGDEFDVTLNAEHGADAQTCNYYGMRLFLDRGFVQTSAGLAVVTATVTDATGHTATGTARMWLGAAEPACIPQDGVTPTIAPAYGSDYDASFTLINDGDTVAVSGMDPTLPMKVLLQGFADSATKVTAELRDPNADPTAATLSSAKLSNAQRPIGSATQESPPRCVSSHTGELDVGQNIGQPLLLHLTADDGLGHKAEATRHVTFTASVQ